MMCFALDKIHFVLQNTENFSNPIWLYAITVRKYVWVE